MKRVATAAVLIPIVLILVFRAPLIVLDIVVAAVALLTIREFLDLTKHFGVEPLRLPTYIFAALVFVGVAASVRGTNPVLPAAGILFVFASAAVLAPFLFSVVTMHRADPRSAYPAAAASVFALLYIAVPLAMLVHVRDMWAMAVPGCMWIFYLLIVVWSGDIFAYYVGRAIGRHKLSPRISPGKTWEGAIASFVGSIALGTFVFSKSYAIVSGLERVGLVNAEQTYRMFVQIDWRPIIFLSAAVNVAAQLGDLIESLIKRGAGVKDSGSLLPGHGGMLDRIDALLFAAPVVWYYAAWRVLS
jgi:phosphatidate cytidylyltransferase